MGFPIVPGTRREQWIKGLLPLGVWLFTDVFTISVAKTAQRIDQLFAVRLIACIKNS